MPSTHYLLVAQRVCRFTKLPKRPSSLRFYAAQPAAPKSRHGSFYSDTLPAMIPVFLLGSAVFLGLQLTYLKLSHEKFIQEASARIAELEAEIEVLQQQRASDSNTQTSSSAGPKSPTSRWRWW